MSQTRPTSQQLTELAAFTPHQRSYVEALIAEAVAPLLVEIENLKSIPRPTAPVDNPRIDAMQLQINDLRMRYEQDDKYVLTRAKIVALLKQQGIY